MLGTKVKIVPIKAYNSIGIVKQYYRPIRRVYLIITTKICNINKRMVLQIAFKAINDSIGPNGLVPILLVYSVYPRITKHNPLLPTIT